MSRRLLLCYCVLALPLLVWAGGDTRRKLAPITGGPDAYFYGTATNTDTYTTAGFNHNNSEYIGDHVTAVSGGGGGGTLTIVSVKQHPDTSCSGTIKIALYWNNGGTWTLWDYGTAAFSSAGNTWINVTLGTPYTIATDEQVWVGAEVDQAAFCYKEWRSAATGGHKNYVAYSSFPQATISAPGTADVETGVRIYVD